MQDPLPPCGSATSIVWALPNRGGTFRAPPGSRFWASITVEFDTGGGTTSRALTYGADVLSLVRFTSQQPAAVSVDAYGVIELHSNCHEEVELTAAIACNSAIYDSKLLNSNLQA
eukprot:3127946-Prymnesium_polylepis.1